MIRNGQTAQKITEVTEKDLGLSSVAFCGDYPVLRTIS